MSEGQGGEGLQGMVAGERAGCEVCLWLIGDVRGGMVRCGPGRAQVSQGARG